MGHWHLASKDVEANKKLFLGMGGKLLMSGGNPLIMFLGVYINLFLRTEKAGDGGSQGSAVNHVGSSSTTSNSGWRNGKPRA